MSTQQPQRPRAAPAQPSSPDGRRQRLAAWSVQNMVWSTLAVGVVALVWWALTSSPTESQRRPPEVVQTASYVAEQSPWPVWVPEPGAGWTPTVVSYDSLEQVRTWHVSYTSPQGEYVALRQAADVTDDWRAAVLRGAGPAGEVRLEGPDVARTWQRWEGEEGSNAERGYLLGPDGSGGSTVVLHGTASQEEFEQLLDLVVARD